jgi:WD40 repeat protein
MKNLFILAGFCLATIGSFAQTQVWSSQVHPSNNPCLGIAFNAAGDKVLTSTECPNAYIRIFDAANGNQLWQHLVDTNVMCQMGVEFSANGNYFVSVEEMGRLLIFDNQQNPPVLIQTLDVGSGASDDIAISPDNTTIAVDGADDTLRLFNLSTGALINKWFAHAGGLNCLDFNQSGSMLATGGSDKNIKIWNTSNGQLIATIGGHAGSITKLKWSPDDIWVVTADATKQCKMSHEMMPGMWMSHHTFNATETVTDIDISSDGKYFLFGGSTKAWIYNKSDQSVKGSFNTTGGGYVWSVAFKPGAEACVIGTGSGKAVYFDLSNLLSVRDLNTTASLNIFPNPASEYVMIKDFPEARPVYQILDLQGSVVSTGNLSADGRLEIQELPAAYYFIRIVGENSIFTASFMKQ